ncbi:hypothetical protein [Bacillus infantis]|uniref:hypothetical protein n=1 Tax=Bacillus infantis TaxID=324767 RepID=UPI00209F4B65|nr:hypothetical protein [Bacillus infantis]MCP1161358.1 hypothetical protein [Bacillus infantis]
MKNNNDRINDIRSNIIFNLYKLYHYCEHSSCEVFEKNFEQFVIEWNGIDQLELKGTPYIIKVTEGKVELDNRVKGYHQIPYQWIKTLRNNLSRDDKL